MIRVYRFTRGLLAGVALTGVTLAFLYRLFVWRVGCVTRAEITRARNE